jgi:hypothetical protein
MPPTFGQALLLCAFAVLTALVSGALLVLAIATSAAALPLLVAVCIGLPLAAGWELPTAIRTIHRSRPKRERAALERLRRQLAELPETRHPLDL